MGPQWLRNHVCDTLEKLKAQYFKACAEEKELYFKGKLTRELQKRCSKEKQRRLEELVRHMRQGHDGEPCPG